MKRTGRTGRLGPLLFILKKKKEQEWGPASPANTMGAYYLLHHLCSLHWRRLEEGYSGGWEGRVPMPITS